jgi:tape measure domain-containing protein
MTKLAPLNLRITGSANGLSAALGKAQKDIQGFSGGLASKLAAFAPQITGLFAGFGAGAFLKAAADVEVVQAKFKALTGSVEQSAAVVKQLRDLAADTPLNFEGVSKAATTLLAYRVPVEDLIPTLRLLGDVALGNQEKLERLSIAFGQVKAKGKLMAQEVNQMVENGFNPLVEISEATGISMETLFKKMEAGQISFDMVVEAFRLATSEGGRFFEAMKAQSETFLGKVAILGESITKLAADIGEKLLPVAKDTVDQLIQFVDWLSKLDASSVETTAKIAAFTAGFAAAVVVLPKVIALGQQVIATIRAIATAQTIAQALGGPKGWATLAVGIAAAGAAVYGVDKIFDSMAASQAKAAQQSQAMADGLDKSKDKAKEASSVFDKLKEGADNLAQSQKQSAQALADKFRDSLQTPAEKYQETLAELSQAVLQGGLDFATFARGVEKAFIELEKFNRESVDSSRPKTALRGSKEARDILDQRDIEAKAKAQAASETQKLQRQLELQQRLDAELKQKESIAKPIQELKVALSNKLDAVVEAIKNSNQNIRTVNV